MTNFIHMIAHWLDWNTWNHIGKPDDDGNLWIAWECDGCGEIKGKHIAQWNRSNMVKAYTFPSKIWTDSIKLNRPDDYK